MMDTANRQIDTLEMMNTALALGLAHGPWFGVSPSIQRSLPPALPHDIEPPPAPSTLFALREYVRGLELVYAENRLWIDAEALLNVGKRRDADWWRRYRLGWIARRFVVEAGAGTMTRVIQSLLSEQSPYVAFDTAVLFADIYRLEASRRNGGGMGHFLDITRQLSTQVRYAIAWHLSCWLAPAKNTEYTLWLDEMIDADHRTPLLDARQSIKNTQSPTESESMNDGWPERPAEIVETGWMSLMGVVDYGSIYSISQLVQMALYHHDRSTAVRSLYAMVDHGRSGITAGDHEDRAIRQFLLSPYGSGWARRVGNCSELLQRLSEHLYYQRVILDIGWAEACSVISKSAAYPVLPLPFGDARGAKAESWPPDVRWTIPPAIFSNSDGA